MEHGAAKTREKEVSDANKDAIKAGEKIASDMRDVIRETERAMDDEQALLMWAAVFAYLGGRCAARLGSGALDAIRKITERQTTRLLNEKVN